MKIVSLSGSLRENVGKKDAKHHRAKGLVPCVMYGGEAQIHFLAPQEDLNDLFCTPEVCFIDVNLNGKTYQAIPQDVQYHKVTDTLLHVDFFELRADRPVKMAVPMVLEGSSPGVLKGGKLIKGLRKIKVSALPKDMPQNIKVNISNLDVSQQIRIRDIKVENFTILEAAATTLVFVKPSRNMAADTEEPKK